VGAGLQAETDTGGGGARLACEGGQGGECRDEPGPWSHTLVACGNGSAVGDANAGGSGGVGVGGSGGGGSVFLIQEGAGRPDLSVRRTAEAELAAEIDRLLCKPPRSGVGGEGV
jgi:hypothetical protein